VHHLELSGFASQGGVVVVEVEVSAGPIMTRRNRKVRKKKMKWFSAKEGRSFQLCEPLEKSPAEIFQPAIYPPIP
jgi:hypothetical protein